MVELTKKSKNILYILLGILTFISIGILLYFLVIKKKPYTCSNDNCEYPKSCQGNVCTTYTCSPDNCESPKSCKDNVCTDVGLSCVGNVCTPYTCSPTNCPIGNTCVSNVCQPNNYTCTYDNCVAPLGSDVIPICVNNMCYFQYDNPKNNSHFGCVSKEVPEDTSTQSSSAPFIPFAYSMVQKYCNANPHCIGYYNSPGNWQIATDTDPIKCTENSTDIGYTQFIYKQKVV